MEAQGEGKESTEEEWQKRSTDELGPARRRWEEDEEEEGGRREGPKLAEVAEALSESEDQKGKD